MMDAFLSAEPVAKKPRTDTTNDDSVWAQCEFTDDDLVEVDCISQAYSQCTKTSDNRSFSGGHAFQRHRSWTAPRNENVLSNNAQQSKFIQPNRTENGCKDIKKPDAHSNRFQLIGFSKQPVVKSWNDDFTFNDENLSKASLKEVERQKQELKRLQADKIKDNEQMKLMNDSLSRKDAEIQSVHEEVESLKRQSVIKEIRQQELEQEIARLKTELDFKCQELASEQWNVSQRQHKRTNDENNSDKRSHASSSLVPQPRQKIFKSPLKATGDNNSFPSQMTFSKRIALKTSEGSSEITGKSTSPSVADIDPNLNDSVLQLRRPMGIETGPGLVDILLQQTAIIQSFPGALKSKVDAESDAHRDYDVPTSPIRPLKNESTRASPNSLRQMQCEPLILDIMTGFSRLLEDDGAVEVNRNAHVPLMPDKLDIFKICLGLRHDRADLLLSSVDKALSGSFDALNFTPTTMSVHTMPSSASSRSLVTEQCSQTADILHMSLTNSISTLKVLKQLVYCSPTICHCLIHRNAGTDHTEKNPQLGTSSAPVAQDNSFHPIVQTLFKFCRNTLQSKRSNLDANSLQLTLEVLGRVATYCPSDELPRFLPLISPRVLQNCSSLVLDGSVFVELISLLVILCSNPNVVEASCSQDDGCFWMPISTAWPAARKELSRRAMSKLDNSMIQLLSTCLIHKGVKIPFLSTNELHCQFEVIQGLVLYLHSQLILYEESPSLLSVPMLRDGVALVHQVASRNAEFRHYCAHVNFEMLTFLYWLARVKTELKIGSAADMLLEMWSIKEYITENKEDFPSTM